MFGIGSFGVIERTYILNVTLTIFPPFINLIKTSPQESLVRIQSVLLLLCCASVSVVGAPSEFSSAPFLDPEKEYMVPVEGGKVYVRTNGIEHKDSVPAIFIHGGPGGIHNGFAGLLGLADERQIVLYDQLGSGKSERPNEPKNWRVERFVEELEFIRRELGISTWHLVGFSWGSALALEYSVKYPQHVASTVLGGTFISTPHWIRDANILVAQAPDDIQKSLELCESDTPPDGSVCAKAYTALYSQFYNPPNNYDQYIEYAERLGGKGFNALIYEEMWGPSEFSATGTLRNYDAMPLLKKIDPRKTSFIIGQYDSARIDTLQEYLLLTPGAEFAVIPGAAHGFIIDRPTVVEAMLRSWFNRLEE